MFVFSAVKVHFRMYFESTSNDRTPKKIDRCMADLKSASLFLGQ